MNYGLRYIMQSGWSEARNRLSGFQPSIINPADGSSGAMWFAGQEGHRALENTVFDFFAPRLGVSWEARKNLVVRAGFGLFNSLWGLNSYGSLGLGVGWAIQGAENSNDLITPIFTLADGPPAPINGATSPHTPDLLNGTR